MKYDLSKLGKGRVGVIGDFCLDVYWHADMTKSELSRETPHFPLPIVQERLSPGGAGNVVANLLALKPKKVHAIGVFGADWRGAALKDLLKKGGADISGVVTDPDRVTNTYIKPLRKGYADNVVYEDPRLDFTNYGPLATATEAKLLKALDAVAKKVDVLCVCDQMPFGCITKAVRERICALGESGLTVIADSRDRIGLYSNVIVKPNEIEASRVFKGKVKPTDFETLAKLLENPSARPFQLIVPPKGVMMRPSTETYPLDPPWLSEALVYINRNVGANITSADVGRHLGMSHTPIDRAFRTVLGTSVQKEIVRARLSFAEHLLKATSQSVGEIASRVGFSRLEYFCTSFRARYGVTPSVYRACLVSGSAGREN